ncbi:TetR/AcrR family transcriptional regulator [Psychrobacillus vulpis]|uniref:TetR/AcrR family transcriptional regulator n=1 Tax=Psychrobacillus vulpis TaxID=2325572 RepID=A0A544TJE4_9BACI|nr:TetR/AcrR family transcriptional regulator [Psychrobacillus vulpis]TQR17551.1 TetR/AcrR family transcriptional regulator [Psychrobacillus vulpis]
MAASDSQQQKMKAKRQRILDEAIELFSEHGYNDTTIAKVAKASGISFGSVFTYFSTKEELFHCAVIEPLGQITDVMMNFDPEAEDPLAELERIVKTHIKLFAKLSTYLSLVVQVIGHDSRFSEQFEELNRFHDAFCLKLSKLIENGQVKGQLIQTDSMYAAYSYMSLLLGLRLMRTDNFDHEIWEQFVPFALNLFGPAR